MVGVSNLFVSLCGGHTMEILMQLYRRVSQLLHDVRMLQSAYDNYMRQQDQKVRWIRPPYQLKEMTHVFARTRYISAATVTRHVD
jgi:hypothetical protein